ncbi:MAG: 50S ribosomal protein L35 [Candidatus Pacebacteria bacterium]|nr:50S ribosomal protein L35 [Candidatus Paceibacterota bacterium]
MTKKLFQKRLKQTKQGKIIRRSSHIGHTKAKEPTKVKRRRRRPIVMEKQKKIILQHAH